MSWWAWIGIVIGLWLMFSVGFACGCLWSGGLDVG
jgi:hypothetical protein